jgi:hypothetical protein
MSTLKVNRIEPRTGDSVEIVGFTPALTKEEKELRESAIQKLVKSVGLTVEEVEALLKV